MSTHRGLAYRAGRDADSLRRMPKAGFKVFQCAYCHDRLDHARDIVTHEAACRLKTPVEELRAYAFRKFVRQWLDRQT